MINLIFLIGFFIIYGLAAFYFVWSTIYGVPFYPSNKKAIKAILDYLPEDKSKKVVELGAGDGRIAFAIARAGYDVVAIEFNPFLSIALRIRKLVSRQKKVIIKNKDFFKEDLSQYDVFVGYLMPHTMAKLDKVLYTPQNKGKLILSNTFQLKNHQPVKVNEKIYYYVID